MTEITKDWCLNMARAEAAAGDPECGAGAVDIEVMRAELMRFSKEELVTELLGALVELASRGPAAPVSRS